MPEFEEESAWNRPGGRAVTRLSLEREVRGSNLGLVKSNTLFPTTRHRQLVTRFGVTQRV